MSKIAIIDLDSIMFSIAHPEKELDAYDKPIKEDGKFVYKDKSIDEMYESADFLMTNLLTQSKAEGYIALIKGKGNFRYSSNEDYKANRPKESPKWWKPVKEYLIDKWNAIEVNEIEVDDAVNIARINIKDSFICAIDNDLLGLEGTHYNWRKDEWITVNNEEANFKFWSDMITGQKGDNIKGLPGKGIKFAERLLTGLEDDYESLRTTTFEEYLNHFGEYEGIKQFYKNYISLRILDYYEGFIIPEITKLNNKIEELF